MMSVCLLWQEPQTVWIDCPRDEQTGNYFFSGLTFRQIGEKLGVSDMSVRESIEASLKKIKKFFD